MDEKDFEENVSDIKIEQRYHERHFNELYNSGYRDGYQANMENEKYLQDGFNIGYNISAKISFLIGTIYACFEKYKFTSIDADFYEDNHELIKLKDLVSTIESQILNYNYDLIIKASSDSNVESNVELNEIFKQFYDRLASIKELILNYKPETANHDAKIGNDMDNLVKLIEEMRNFNK